MPDREKVIKGLKICKSSDKTCSDCPYNGEVCTTSLCDDVLTLLKEQEEKIENLEQEIRDKNQRLNERAEQVDAMLKEQETEWEHLWDAPDRTYKGRCKKCGFVHFFIEGHNKQYKFCPECGRSVKLDDI